VRQLNKFLEPVFKELNKENKAPIDLKYAQIISENENLKRQNAELRTALNKVLQS
jgi:hypothetical protein